MIYDTQLIADQVYSRAGGRDRLANIHLPDTGDNGLRPAVIFLHGGAWRFGDRHLAPDLSRFFAQAGFVMVSIDYRLSDEALFPASVIDTKCAIRWLRHHADRFGVDPNRIALWGSSAGGHLASLAALSGAGDFTSDEWADVGANVCAVSQGYGPTNFLRIDAHRDPNALPGRDPESAKLPPPGPSAPATSLESLYLGAAIGEVPDKVDQADPARYADASACPFQILHGDCDAHVPFDQSRYLFEALTRAGAQAELIRVPGLGHGFLNRNDLDDPGPRALTRWTSHSPDQPDQITAGVFDTILRFFQRH